jgi:hypothetical protein
MSDAPSENARRAELYRTQSKLAANLAESAMSQDECETLLKMATEWLRLATEIEGLIPGPAMGQARSR